MDPIYVTMRGLLLLSLPLFRLFIKLAEYCFYTFVVGTRNVRRAAQQAFPEIKSNKPIGNRQISRDILFDATLCMLNRKHQFPSIEKPLSPLSLNELPE